VNHFEVDELFGWVYQYFGEDKRDELANRVNNNGHKLAGSELATSTQTFTPRYIVEWLVDNSVGRIWHESPHSDSALNYATHLAPHDDGLQSRPPTDPESVTVFDPACGGGHMLLYAVELLQDWYREVDRSYTECEIIETILTENIYGVDLDPGAASLTTLALFTKAKTVDVDATIDQINVFGTGGIEFTDDQKDALREAAGDGALETTLLDRVLEEFHDLSTEGSLVRIRDRIEDVLDEIESVEDVRPDTEAQITSQGMTASNDLVIGDEAYSRDEIEQELFDGLRKCVDEALDTDTFEAVHRSELDSSIDLLDVLTGSYDVVVTNPPYLVSNKMNDELKQALKDDFKGSRDIYAAFIERNLEYVADDGYVAMITMETFMFQYVFRGFRPWFLERAQFVDTAHIRNRDSGYMDVAFIYRNRRESDSNGDIGTQSQFTRLVDVDEGDENKREVLADKIQSIRAATGDGDLPEEVSRVDQQRFAEIPRTRFLYWFGDEILELFERYPSLEDEVDFKVGLQTGADDTFVRDWWELPPSDRPSYPLGGSADQYAVQDESREYRWFAQSGDDNEFLDPTTKLVRWGEKGEEIREADSKAYIRNEPFYGRGGVTFRLFSSYLTARIQPEGHFFGHTAHFGRTTRVGEDTTLARSQQDDVLLAYLNSSLARFIIDGFNPGLRYEVGDVSNLPWVGFQAIDNPDELAEYAQRAVDVQVRKFRLDEIRPTFDPELFPSRVSDLQYERDLAQADVATLDGLIDDAVFNAFDISPRTRERAIKSGDIPTPVHGLKHPHNLDPLPDADRLPRDVIEIDDTPRDRDQLVEAIEECDGTDVREIAAEIGVAPQTVAVLRSEADLYTDDERREVAARLVSHCVGIAFGRWQLPSNVTLDEDLSQSVESVREGGIVPTTESGDGQPTLGGVVLDLIEVLEAETGLSAIEVETRLGTPIVDWLENDYFEDYLCKQYRGRGERSPIYIQLGGPNADRTWFVSYHAMDSDTLERLISRVDKATKRAESTLETLESAADDAPTADTNTQIANIESALADMEQFRDRLDAASPEFDVDVDAGIDELLMMLDDAELLVAEKPSL